MAQKTFNELADDIDELMEIAGEYMNMPAGDGRNKLHMIYFGLAVLHNELEAGRKNRDAVARSKARRASGEYRGQLGLFEVPSAP